MASITKKSQSRRAARREEIVALLLKTVELLLDEGESYTEMSVERVVATADISRSTFYVYFEDKGDLLLALTEGVVESLLEAGAPWWELTTDVTKDELESTVLGIIDAYRPHELLWGAIVDAAAYDARVRERFSEMINRGAAEFERHIRDGQRSGFVREELDARLTARWLAWMIERGLYQLVRGAEPAQVKRLGQALAAIFWNVLYEGAAR